MTDGFFTDKVFCSRNVCVADNHLFLFFSRFISENAKAVLGVDNHDHAVKILFEMLQQPKLNKQVWKQWLSWVSTAIFQVFGMAVVRTHNLPFWWRALPCSK